MEFDYQGKQIYFEDYGEGEALLIINGIFMSSASWAAFIPSFSKRNRLLLIDLLDQGKSDKMTEEYNQDVQVEMLMAFIAYLKLDVINIMGISYGGEVAMKLAARHPGLIRRLILSNTAAYTSPWLKDIGKSWEYAFKSGDGHQFFKTCIPIIYSPKFYEKNYAWASAREDFFVKTFDKAVYDAFARLTRSAETHDERMNLIKIKAPTLVISSEYDFITPIFMQKEIMEAIEKASWIMVPDAGHALMYEKPDEFIAIVLGFIYADQKSAVT